MTTRCPHCGKEPNDHSRVESMEHVSLYLADPDTTVKDSLQIMLGQVGGLYDQVQARPANPSSKRMVIGALAGLAHVIQDGLRRIDE